MYVDIGSLDHFIAFFLFILKTYWKGLWILTLPINNI